MRLNRKIAALIISAIYVLSSGAAPECFKLPVLVSHYYDHQEENTTVTLAGFLLQHYYYEDGTDKDAEEDNKLPFKSAENTSVSSTVSLPPPVFGACIINPLLKTSRIFGMYKNEFLLSQYLNNIWQPPRPSIA